MSPGVGAGKARERNHVIVQEQHHLAGRLIDSCLARRVRPLVRDLERREPGLCHPELAEHWDRPVDVAVDRLVVPSSAASRR